MASPKHLASGICVTALVAACAALFAPEAPGGLDLGAIGASVFVIALIAGAWLVSHRAEEIFPEDASVTERRSWIGLGFVAIILATFARHLTVLAHDPVLPAQLEALLANHFLPKLGLLLVAWGVTSRLVSARAGSVQADERDLRLRHRAERLADATLVAVIIGAIAALAWLPAQSLEGWLTPTIIANALIGVLIAKSLVEHAALVLAYRLSRG